MEFDFDRIIDRRQTNSVKWEFMQTLDPGTDADTLPFWIADMDFASPPAMIEAIKERADQLIMGYSMADEDYHLAVLSWFARRFNWTVGAETIFISPGVVPAIKTLLLALTGAGDWVIIQRPVYYPFSILIENTGRRVVNNPLVNKGGRYTIDFLDLEQKARQATTTMMLLCSPHNPVGRVWTREELERVGRICLDNGVILVSDEIHCDLVRRGVQHVPLTTLFPDQDRIITCTSPSKTFNAAGLQMANIIIEDPDMQKKWTAQVGPELAPPLGLAATRGAYLGGEQWLEALKAYLDENFCFMEDFFARNLPGVRFTIAEGTYLAWIDFSGYGCGDRELSRLLVEKGRVLLEGGTMFGPEGSGFQRMNIACPRSLLARGLEGIATALSGR